MLLMFSWSALQALAGTGSKHLSLKTVVGMRATAGSAGGAAEGAGDGVGSPVHAHCSSISHMYAVPRPAVEKSSRPWPPQNSRWFSVGPPLGLTQGWEEHPRRRRGGVVCGDHGTLPVVGW
jgi:hypothetical protein